MRNRIGLLTASIIGIIIVAFTLSAFFLLGIERIPVNIWALVFLLLSEFALFGGLIGLQIVGRSNDSLLLRVGVTMSLSLYFLSSLVAAYLAPLFRNSLNIFILIELAIIAFFAIVIGLFIAWSSRIKIRDNEDIKKISTNTQKRGNFSDGGIMLL